MNRLIKIFSFFIVLWIYVLPISVWAGSAKPVYPTVGQPCPDFVLQHIAYFPKKTASLKDFRGKWLLLDFWNHACSACIASFPHVNEMQKELGDKLQVMMVGIQDDKREVNLLYSRYRDKEQLVMPCAFDSAIARRFDILTAPYSILIDDKGVVQCITSSFHTDEMKAFLAGGHPEMPKVHRMHEESRKEDDTMLAFNPRKPFAIEGNGGQDSVFLLRSMLTPWKEGINKLVSYGGVTETMGQVPGHFFVLGASLKDLYFYAYAGTQSSFLYLKDSYYGKYYNRLILEVNDSSLFDYRGANHHYKNLFCYAVDLPDSNGQVQRAQLIMRRDLEACFGFKATLETRKITCWKLVALPGTKERLKAKGGAYSMEGNMKVGYRAKNMPFVLLYSSVRTSAGDQCVFDETGITGMVDVDMECEGCLLRDFTDLRKILHNNGLELEPMEKQVQAIVVRDAAHAAGKEATSSK